MRHHPGARRSRRPGAGRARLLYSPRSEDSVTSSPRSRSIRFLALASSVLVALALCAASAIAAPKVIVISLDGASPRFVDQYLASGVLGPNEGLGLLKRVGIHAKQNVTISPSLTAAGH